MKTTKILHSLQKSLRNFFIEENGTLKSSFVFLRKHKNCAFFIFIKRLMISFFINQFIFCLLFAELKLKKMIFLPILGGVLWLFLTYIVYFFCQNFLEKKARSTDFSYVKAIVSLIFSEVSLSLFPVMLVMFALYLAGEVKAVMKMDFLVWMFYFAGFFTVLTFCYRIGPMKIKLIELQDRYKKTDTE